MEFSPPKAKVDAMHVLTTQTAKDRLREAPLFQASSVPQLLSDPPSMDHLDALEAQSIYILREAFARLKKLALLWSLGKDSNVMIWLARKAFLGRVPFPAMHVDTGKKFPEMYAFRDHYGKEWDLDLRIEPCPPIDAVDPPLPPAARSAARKTEGLKMALGKYGFDGLIAGIRRDEEATRAKERVFSPRGLGGNWDVRDPRRRRGPPAGGPRAAAPRGAVRPASPRAGEEGSGALRPPPPEFWDQFN